MSRPTAMESRGRTDLLNAAISSALGGGTEVGRARELLAHAMSEELGSGASSVRSEELFAAVDRRLRSIEAVRALLKCETESRGAVSSQLQSSAPLWGVTA